MKPIFSRDLGEAKRRVRELYRAWYREVPNAGEGLAMATLARAAAQLKVVTAAAAGGFLKGPSRGAGHPRCRGPFPALPRCARRG